MDGFFMFIPIIVFFVFAVVVGPLLASLKKVGKQQPMRTTRAQRAPGTYNREVDSIHQTTDAATEKRQRLEQLKNLYESGMMERDEYEERIEGVENDYRRMR